MDGFSKVALDEYKFTLTSDSNPEQNRQLVVIAESIEAASEQASKFAEHLLTVEDILFQVSAAEKLENFQVTYTEAAWAQLFAVV